MLDDDQTTSTSGSGNDEAAAEPLETPAKPVVKKTTRKAPAKRAAKKAADPVAQAVAEPVAERVAEPVAEPAVSAEATEKPVVKKTTRKRAAKKPAATPDAASEPVAPEMAVEAEPAPKKTAKKTAARKRPAAKPESSTPTEVEAGPEDAPLEGAATGGVGAVLFQAPDATKAPVRRTRKRSAAAPVVDDEQPILADADDEDETAGSDEPATDTDATAAATAVDTSDGETDAEDTEDTDGEGSDGDGSATRRRRRRGGRRRRKPGEGADTEDKRDDSESPAESDSESDDSGDEQTGDAESGEASSRRRRRRRRAGEEGGGDDAPNTVTRVRKPRGAEDQITSVSGSTRLEAKKQRRREGREAGRRRAPIVSEAEFLARRESVERVMVVRQREDLTQIAVIEDKVLVEHYVARESQTSLIGNIYLGRVQNVLPSMEAAFIDIGKGRNAVLYAGEVNWSALGHKDGQPRKIESVLTSGQPVLVQVTKDPIGHKGARLTSQISLAGRFLVYVPDGTTSGISRKLPDTERNRLKALLKDIVPDTAGVIVRTAAEGASEEELTRDVERLKARWEDVEKKAANKNANAQLLYGEPDLTLKVVRDLFTEDFSKLVIEGDDAWDTVHEYVEHVAPDLSERLERFERGPQGKDSFATYRIDEQISKGLDRKVWLPSGGSLVIDRTEAMTVVDVNTGKFTGSGGNLEETVTKNNLEAAEEIVRQLRLRDIGGIIVVDFIDMVLESNRDLVVRRLVECLGRDRTRHQVAEVTSLGLVQMTRKRIGTGLLEAFSENCEHCQGRGVVIRDTPVEPSKSDDDGRRSNRRRGRRGDDNGAGDNDDNASAGGRGSSGRGSGRGGRGSAEPEGGAPSAQAAPSPKDVAAMARHDKPEAEPVEARSEPEPQAESQVETQPEPQPAAPAEQATVPEPEVAAATEPAPEPAKPAVVTRTRRRSASRPAGPPAGVTGTQPTTGQVEPGTATIEPGASPVEGADGAPADVSTIEHVPVKKRGPRKR